MPIGNMHKGSSQEKLETQMKMFLVNPVTVKRSLLNAKPDRRNRRLSIPASLVDHAQLVVEFINNPEALFVGNENINPTSHIRYNIGLIRSQQNDAQGNTIQKIYVVFLFSDLMLAPCNSEIELTMPLGLRPHAQLSL